MPQVRSASGRRSTSPQPRRIFPQRQALFGAAQEFKKLLEPNQTQALRQTLSVSTVQSSTALARAWRYPAAGSSQNLCWIPLGKRRLVPRAQFPTPSYSPGRRTPCTCSLATSNGNGGKTPAPPGNCCPRRKVHIRIRGPTPARCSPVPGISPAQGRLRRAGLAGSEDALPPRRTT